MKLTLSDVTNLLGNPTSAQNTINANSDAIEAALENTLSRNGDSPNHMLVPLDMNHKGILNGGVIEVTDIVVNGESSEGLLEQMEQAVEDAQAAAESAAASAEGIGDVISDALSKSVRWDMSQGLSPESKELARDNIGLGTMSTQNAADYSVTSDFAEVAFSGAYSDLSGAPNLSLYQTRSEKNAANGYAGLGPDGKVPSEYLPIAGSYKGTWNASTNTPTLVSSVGFNGDRYTVSVAGTTNLNGITSWSVGDEVVFTTTGNVWQKIPSTATVTSVAGKVGAVTLVKGDVGLGNVDNTSDANKPVSTAQQTAINGRVPTTRTLTAGSGIATIGDLSADRTIGLSAGALASLALADTALQSGAFGLGVTGNPTQLMDLDAIDTPVGFYRTLANSTGTFPEGTPIPALVTITRYSATQLKQHFSRVDVNGVNPVWERIYRNSAWQVWYQIHTPGTYGIGAPYGGSVVANIDATNIPAGTYRVHGGTTGTKPWGSTSQWAIVDVGYVGGSTADPRPTQTLRFQEDGSVYAGREFFRSWDVAAGVWLEWEAVLTVNKLRSPPTGTVPLAAPLHFERSIPLNVREMGVIGNDNEGSLVDEYTALKAAFDRAVLEKRELLFNDTNYMTGTSIAVVGDISAGGANNKRPRLFGTQALANAGSSILSSSNTGTTVSSFTLAVNMEPGRTRITLNTSTGISVGDLICLNSDQYWYYDPRTPTPGWKKGEMHRVTRIVNSTTVAIDGCVQYKWQPGSETVTVYVFTPTKRLGLHDMDFHGRAPASDSVLTTGLFIANSWNAELDNLYFNGFVNAAVELRRAWAVRTDDIYIDGSGALGAHGYGIACQNVVGGRFNGLRARSLRRSFDANTTSAVAHGISRDNIVSDFHINGGGYESNGDEYYPPLGNGTTTGVYNAGVGGHGGYDGLTFQNGYIANVYDGVTCRGRNTVIRNVQFSGQVYRLCYFTYGSGLTFENNRYDNGLVPYTTVSKDAQAHYGVFLGNEDSGSTDNLPQFDNPIIIKNNVMIGGRKALVSFSRNGTLTASNVYVDNNIVHLNPAVGDSFNLVSGKFTGQTVNLRGGSISGNLVLGSDDYSQFSSNVIPGQASTGAGQVLATRVGPSTWRGRVADDAVIRIQSALGVGSDSTPIKIVSGTAQSADVVIFPASTTVRKATGVANAVSGTDFGTGLDFTATAASLTGTTGTDGRTTVGMSSTGDIYLENRSGATITVYIVVG